MEKVDDDSAAGGEKQMRTQDLRQLAIQHCIKCLVHSCKCQDPDCRFRDCQRMKNILQHSKTCSKIKANGGCPVCKQLFTLCCFHAKNCLEIAVCPIPFCINIKHKLKTQTYRKRISQLVRRRIAMIENHRMTHLGLHDLNPENSNSSRRPSSSSQPHPLSHSQSVMDMKPSSGPPIGALLAVQQVQAAAARQIAGPQILMPQMRANIPNYRSNAGNIASWGHSGFALDHQLRQNNQLPSHLHLQPLTQFMGGISVSNSIDSTVASPQLIPNPGSSVDDMLNSTQDWQELFQTLRISSTNSPPPPNSSYPKC